MAPTDQYEYFDGREWAAHEVYEWEADSVDVEIEEFEVMLQGEGIQKDSFSMWVEPPHRYLYPRPVESVDEARTLYLTDEIDIHEFEGYLDRLLSAEISETEIETSADPPHRV